MMYTKALSSAEAAGKSEASCLHVSSWFFGSFYRAKARERDEAKGSRATNCNKDKRNFNYEHQNLYHDAQNISDSA